jgi:alpha-amylase/alpha-mannosidase (GH57 family)
MHPPTLRSTTAASLMNDGQAARSSACHTGVAVCIHGHFYQPPRENPYLGAIERQPGAAPFHDWNERIHSECYRPNAFARVLNDRGEVIDIVNNYAYISFNIGPTLFRWLERHDPETYQRILEADRASCERLDGHGNAIAQVYNHIILPLANERDKRTQIRWGKADFVGRFGREPEGIWLAETAIDYPTLEALADEGFKFTILAPSQAQRCRPLVEDGSEPDWHEVGGSQIDPTRPYRCFLPSRDQNGDRRYVDIFFYDGPISRDMGFNDLLASSQHFAGRIGQAVRGDHRPHQLLSVATDGETFGHHRGGAEKTLAYAVTRSFPEQGWTVTNFAHYRHCHPPTWEVELKPVTAWSCAHGVDRWQDDCGCGGGGLWHQRWRRPLREALDWLRDALAEIYTELGSQFFHDPWAARDAYSQVVGDRSEARVKRFFAAHQRHKLSRSERVQALQLLEMQYHALLMYTSCGWFFEEISRPEGTQILRYAARAIELAGEVAGVELESQFIQKLETAPSNVPEFETGAGIYRQLVAPSQVTPEQVAAHYAMGSLFTPFHRDQVLYCYTIHQQDYQIQRLGPLSLAVGQVQLTSTVTRERTDLSFAVLHLGGWDFHCCIQTFRRRLAYQRAKEAVFAAMAQASAAQTMVAISREFGDRAYSLQDLLPEERHRIMQWLSQGTLQRLDQLYTQVYRDNYGLLRAFHRDGIAVPQELQVAAEVAIGHRALEGLRALEKDTSDPDVPLLQQGLNHLGELEAIAHEARQLNCRLSLPTAPQILEPLIQRALWQVLADPQQATLSVDVEWIGRLVELANNLGIGLNLSQAQELFWRQMTRWLPSLGAMDGAQLDSTLKPLTKLAGYLAIDVPALVTHTLSATESSAVPTRPGVG